MFGFGSYLVWGILTELTCGIQDLTVWTGFLKNATPQNIWQEVGEKRLPKAQMNKGNRNIFF